MTTSKSHPHKEQSDRAALQLWEVLSVLDPAVTPAAEAAVILRPFVSLCGWRLCARVFLAWALRLNLNAIGGNNGE